ncbi:MAG: endolytic transglycosylase MltG [Rickettsiales bacterium]|nr:endolytic transglycosylase MltG [Rickettsiales bacterium]
MSKFKRIAVGLGIFCVMAIALYVFAVPQARRAALFEVERGDVLERVGARLYEDGLVRSKFAFKVLAHAAFRAGRLQAGEYEIAEGASLWRVVSTILGGRAHNRYITVPEGKTLLQIEAMLADFPGRRTVMLEEGWLLPQTYFYQKRTTKDEILLRMKGAMEEALAREWAGREDGLPLASPQEALVLASIVEKETGIAEERPIIASVFVNRLRKKMRLQSDPTVVYTLTGKLGDMRGRRLLARDLRKDSAYNTYTRGGLPAGAICNPGLESIRAVLHPASTTYLYFVADGAGGHKFADTLDAHEKNRAEWRKIRK